MPGQQARILDAKGDVILVGEVRYRSVPDGAPYNWAACCNVKDARGVQSHAFYTLELDDGRVGKMIAQSPAGDRNEFQGVEPLEAPAASDPL